MIETSPGLGDGGSVGQHAHGALDFGEIATGYYSWWLVVDAHLKTSGAPVDELDGALGLDGGDSGIDVFRYHVSTIKHAASHILAMTWVAFHHLISRFKASIGNLSNRELLVVGFFC